VVDSASMDMELLCPFFLRWGPCKHALDILRFHRQMQVSLISQPLLFRRNQILHHLLICLLMICRGLNASHLILIIENKILHLVIRWSRILHHRHLSHMVVLIKVIGGILVLLLGITILIDTLIGMITALPIDKKCRCWWKIFGSVPMIKIEYGWIDDWS
jgi:hypothetical protein